MRPGLFLLIFSSILVTACGGTGWPGQYGEDPSVFDFPVVRHRWEAASRTALGTAQDVAEIKEAIRKKRSDVIVHEIRWISATEVMAYVAHGEQLALGSESFYSVVKKDGDHWHLVAWYDNSI